MSQSVRQQSLSSGAAITIGAAAAPMPRQRSRLLSSVVSRFALSATISAALNCLGGACPPLIAQAEAATLTVAWVDDDGVQAKANHITTYFTTISDAMHAVGPGGIVYVLPGTYNNSKGVISVLNGKSLIAMLDATHQVNPTNDPNNTNWPVIIDSFAGNAIESYVGSQNVTIHGFYIRRSAGNGIQIQGLVTQISGVDPASKKNVASINISSICAHMTVSGNRIESTYMDGIKVFGCNDVHIVGNYIRYTSGITAATGQQEQAIDLMAVANSEVRGNKVLDNAIGIDVKGGSVNVTVVNNNFAGPFAWVAQSGEPVNTLLPYSAASSPQPWGVKDLVVTGNVMRGHRYDVAVNGCQSCTYAHNTLGGGGFLIVADAFAATKNLCIQDTAPVTDQTSGVSVAHANCPTAFPAALIVPGTPRGVDIRPAN